MLIRHMEQLELLGKAQQEIKAQRWQMPSGDFYQKKLSAAWRRASRSPAYTRLAEFSDEAFGDLRPTEKRELKAAPWDFMAESLDHAAKYYETTGTSGQVTPTPRLVEDVLWNVVSVAEAWRDILHDEDRVAILLPSDIVPVADLIVSVSEYLKLPHTRLYPFTVGISDWDRLIGVWRTLRPTTVFLSPGVALQLSRLLAQRDLLTGLRDSVRSLMLLGEVSTPALRRRLGQWWEARAYDASYGSTETGTLAATCPEGSLHLLTTTNYFEVLGSDTIVPLPSALPLTTPISGRLVVTPLNLYARPLLRFDTGDEVTVGTGCPCSSLTPTVVVSGRAGDVVGVRGVPLITRAVEEVVYGQTSGTGYLIEVTASGDWARLLVERAVDADRTGEPAAVSAVQDASSRLIGLRWDSVTFVNTLPATTKAGGSQKSWKRSNVRVLERVS